MITFILGIGALLGVIYLVKTLMTTKESSTSTNTNITNKSEVEVQAKIDEVMANVPVADKVTPVASASTKPDTMSDAEWAMSNQNPNRVEVAPVVVTVDTPNLEVTNTQEVETPVAPVKKPRAKKASTPKARKKAM